MLGICRMPGYASDGSFQEYIATYCLRAIVPPKGLSAVEAAPLSCAGVTSYYGIANLGPPEGQWVVVIGCGGLGHLGIQFAKAKRYWIIAPDVVDGQLEGARACGAEHVFSTNTDGDYVQRIKKITSGGATLLSTTRVPRRRATMPPPSCGLMASSWSSVTHTGF